MTRRNACLIGLLSLFGVGGADGQRGQRPAPQRGNQPKDTWRAWAITKGTETQLTIEGIYANGGPGTVVVVKPATPQGINAKVLILDVKVGTLPGVWPAIATPIPASYTVSPYKSGTHTSVHIRYPDGNSLTIDSIIDSGEGPNFK